MVDIEWLKRHLQRLLPMSDQLSSIYPEVVYEKRGWAALKLVCLMFYADVYTKIIPKYYDKMVYIDLLAGSGINRVKETGDLIIGSPIIAATMESPFDRLIFVDCEQKIRAERAKKKGFDKNQIKIREKFQISLDNKLSIADNKVENNSDFSAMVRQVADIFYEIMNNG